MRRSSVTQGWPMSSQHSLACSAASLCRRAGAPARACSPVRACRQRSVGAWRSLQGRQGAALRTCSTCAPGVVAEASLQPGPVPCCWAEVSFACLVLASGAGGVSSSTQPRAWKSWRRWSIHARCCSARAAASCGCSAGRAILAPGPDCLLACGAKGFLAKRAGLNLTAQNAAVPIRSRANGLVVPARWRRHFMIPASGTKQTLLRAPARNEYAGGPEFKPRLAPPAVLLRARVPGLRGVSTLLTRAKVRAASRAGLCVRAPWRRPAPVVPATHVVARALPCLVTRRAVSSRARAW